MTLDEEDHLIFMGLVSMIDPPREESREAVSEAKRAGIRPVMITGDHKITATAIAEQIGIFGEGDMAVTGPELDEMSDAELDENIEKISVYARVSPENKIRIVDAWQRKGAVTAMTGDGVNDAPALKKADIGVAMGITGTEVSKDAASMILTDDNFATIIKAVANGRNVYRNIKNAVKFLLSGNMAGIMAVLYTSLAALPVPFQPVSAVYQSADGFPAGHCHWDGKGRKRSAFRAATGSETGNPDKGSDDSPFRARRSDRSLYHDRFPYRFVHGQCHSQFYGVCHTDSGKTVPWIQLQKQTFDFQNRSDIQYLQHRCFLWRCAAVGTGHLCTCDAHAFLSVTFEWLSDWNDCDAGLYTDRHYSAV